MNETLTGRSSQLAAVNEALEKEIGERRRQEKELTAHYLITRILAETTGITEATSEILQAVCESMGWDVGVAWVLDDESQVLRCVDVWHRESFDPADFVKATRQMTFSSGTGLPGRVWASGSPLWVPDVTRDADCPRAPVASMGGLHGAFGFPIHLGSNVFGVIEFFSREVREPDDNLLRMFAAVGSQVGQFIDRQQAEDALRKTYDDMELRIQDRTAELLKINQALQEEIRDREHAEEALRESEERFRQVTAMAGEWIWEQDAGGRYLYSSSGVHGILGYTPKEIIGKYYYELLNSEDREHMAPLVSQVIGPKQSFFRSINRYRHKDGRDVYTESSGTPIFGADGSLLKWRGVEHDITERKRFEDALRLRERAIEASSVGIIITDAKRRGHPIIYANPAFARMTGFSRDEVVGRNARFLQGPDTDPEAISEIRQALQEVRDCHITLKNYRKDGTTFWNELLISPVRNERGTLTHFIGIQTDITRLRRAEEERHEMEIAKQIQLSLLPPAPLKMDGALVAGCCLPATHVGGDYFDYFCRQNALDIVIADVSGHSVGAALVMAETRSTLKAEARWKPKETSATAPGAGEVLRALNALLFEDLNRADLFITMFYMKYHFDTRELFYASAGHNRPLLLCEGEETCRDLDVDGLILGVKREVDFEEKSLSLKKGDLVLLYTDGIPEAENKDGEFFGVSRLEDLFIAHRDRSPQAIIDVVIKALQAYCQSQTFRDDISMVVLKIT